MMNATEALNWLAENTASLYGDEPGRVRAFRIIQEEHADLLEACKWIHKFISTSCDGGDAWCAVRDQDGATEWAKSLIAVVAKAEPNPITKGERR